jgi:hypothetical protein
LESVHAATFVSLRHFLMEYAASRRHPLHVAGSKRSAIAKTVAMRNGTGEDIGYGFDAAMGMPGKSGAVVIGAIIAEIIEQEEWVELLRFAESKGAVKLYTRAFERRLRLHDLFNGSN